MATVTSRQGSGTQPGVEPAQGDQRVVMRGLGWEGYTTMLRLRGGRPVPRMIYLDGDLILMSPAYIHEFVKELIDQQHAWYHQPLAELAKDGYLARHLYALSVYDSIVVMEKRQKNPPFALVRGGEGHVNVPQTGSFIDLRRAFGVPD